MASVNHVCLLGNLTREPVLRRTGNGTAVGELGLAVSESYKNKQGENVESTCYVDVETWDRQAETCEEYLRKGSQVIVQGRLKFDEWTTKEGEKRNKLRVRADRIQFLGESRKKQNGGEQREGASQKGNNRS